VAGGAGEESEASDADEEPSTAPPGETTQPRGDVDESSPEDGTSSDASEEWRTSEKGKRTSAASKVRERRRLSRVAPGVAIDLQIPRRTTATQKLKGS
jgi:hypothetical protein